MVTRFSTCGGQPKTEVVFASMGPTRSVGTVCAKRRPVIPSKGNSRTRAKEKEPRAGHQ